MSDFKVVLPTTTEEWQRDMKLAYNKAIDDFTDRLKGNIYPMSHGLGVHDIDRIAESLKQSCISKTFREIDTDYIAEQLKVGGENDGTRGN